jgi:Uncharacterized protein conserved in bacteria (DUF2064)
MRSERAIIFFVRDGRREAAIKPLPACYRAHGYDLLNRRVAARMRPLLREGIDLVVVSNGTPLLPGAGAQLPQRGDSFGERLGNAIADTLALGYSQVVVIGNDCPAIDAADLSAAFDALQAGASLVAAPTHDGGAFLIGARGDIFPADEFVALPWRTSHLFEALTGLRGAVALPILRNDFDTWTGRAAADALASLLGGYDRSIVPAVVSHSLRSASCVKALMRIHLPAPPAR